MSESGAAKLRALLLVGPTGSGKTPLGDWLEAHGLAGRRCRHFDFGANLRAVATGKMTDDFTPDEVRFIQGVLERGVLLEDETFYLAARILDAFLRRGQAKDLLILNGLPRHVGQAEAVDRLLEVAAVVSLECSLQTVRERIRRNAGGDRTTRTDDRDTLLASKLATFDERTRALVSHYAERGVPVLSIAVGIDTQPADIVRELERLWI